MRFLTAGVSAALLAGCAASPADVALDGLNLADGTTLSQLQAALAPDDRAALGTYAILHWPKSKFYCGEPIGGRVAVARTVGEAIALTRAYERQLVATQSQARVSSRQAGQSEERDLVIRMERLVFQRDVLRAQMGPGAEASPEGMAIKRQLDTLRAEIAQVRERPAS